MKDLQEKKQQTMKNKFKILAISLTFGILIGISAISIAQPPPPGPATGHGQNGDQEPAGGMAPVGGGLIMLLSMGATYFAFRVFHTKKQPK